MPYQIEIMPHEAIFVVTHLPPYRLEESDIINAKVEAWSQTVDPPRYVIRDMTNVHFTWRIMLKALDKHIRGRPGTITDSRFRHVLVGIGSNMSLRTALKELDMQTFGTVDLESFETLDEALAHCRGELARME